MAASSNGMAGLPGFPASPADGVVTLETDYLVLGGGVVCFFLSVAGARVKLSVGDSVLGSAAVWPSRRPIRAAED